MSTGKRSQFAASENPITPTRSGSRPHPEARPFTTRTARWMAANSVPSIV